MGKLSLIVRSLAAVALVSVMAGQALAQRPYRPQVGDALEIYHHYFGARYEKGKAAMLAHMPKILSSDGLVREIVIAGNKKTGEIVIVCFSDPYNASRWKIKGTMKPVLDLTVSGSALSEARIFAINDEGVNPKPGDLLLIYRQVVPHETLPQVRKMMEGKLTQQLRGDHQKRNSYFAESDSGPQAISVAIGDRSYKRHFAFRSDFDKLAPKGVSRLGAAEFEVLMVHRERAR